MKEIISVLAVLAASAASAQPLIETIFLPDSLGGMTNPLSLAFDSIGNKMGMMELILLMFPGCTAHRGV